MDFLDWTDNLPGLHLGISDEGCYFYFLKIRTIRIFNVIVYLTTYIYLIYLSDLRPCLDVDAEDVDPERHLGSVGGQGDVARHLHPGLQLLLQGHAGCQKSQPIETGIKVIV